MEKEENKLTGYFENYLKQEPLFLDKKVLQSNYYPENILHREEQIQKVAAIMAPALRGEKPSNMFIYGKTGSGKTLTIKHVCENMMEIAKKNSLKVNIFYLNCKLKRVSDTEYRLIAELARALNTEIPATGLPTDEVYKMFINTLEKQNILMIIVLDEIDQLVSKSGDQILYSLTRINSELKNSQVAIVGVSNDLVFADNLDPRIKSSLSEEEVVFSPYNALQLQSILKERAKLAFKDNIIEEGVIEKCSAYAAREHGDARRALELLRVSGEVAERENSEKVKISHIDMAEERIEKERVLDIIAGQPKQTQLALYSIVVLDPKPQQTIYTGEVYEIYKKLCYKTNVRPLTMRRLSDIIGELDMFGIINTKTISKGRYGRTREINLAVPKYLYPNVKKILEESLEIQNE